MTNFITLSYIAFSGPRVIPRQNGQSRLRKKIDLAEILCRGVYDWVKYKILYLRNA